MVIVGIILSTLAGAAIWYFFCGLSNEDESAAAKGDKSNTGCIVALVLGFIGTLILWGIAALSHIND